MALTGGPWVVSNSYLAVMQWKLNFDPANEVTSKIAVWIRLPAMSMDLFDRKLLFDVGSEVGRVLKID